MNADPFAGIEQAVQEAVNRLERECDGSRDQWSDRARSSFDAKHGHRVLTEAKASVAPLRRVGEQLRTALDVLKSTE